MAPEDSGTDDIAKRAAPLVALAHGLTGVVLGLLFGWYLWTRWQLRSFAWLGANYLDSWQGFAIVVLGPSILLGILGACLKERFWENWRYPFWWS